jgi:2-polyprenyl-6-methoxyphenol hydroxylase-like FAD-dependent oxidoreductase
MNNSYEVKTGTQKSIGRHVLVLGGSLAGLFAARVLADFFDKVTILDRDVFPVAPNRKGVPQSYHAHALLPTAFPILERFFPGIMNDLRRDGAVPFALVSPRGLLPLPKYPGEIIPFSRPLLEWHVRDRVSNMPGVYIMVNTEVIKLLSTQDRSRVIGVQTRRTEEVHAISTTIQADLVVDASG